MKLLAKVYVNGRPARQFESKGKTLSVTDVYVYTQGKPFPEQVGVLQDVKLAEGTYTVPFDLDVYNGRLGVKFDFANAVAVADQGKAS